MRRFTEVQEAQLGAITEKCRTLSNSVRIRAALEERDIDDLYRNALTELHTISNRQLRPLRRVRTKFREQHFSFT